ncbi:MAG: alpha/beta hydrolase [Polyangiaceae bacterium]
MTSSYRQQTNWLRYQPFFPEAMRCDEDSAPEESWWHWNGLEVHLDRLKNPAAPLKAIVLHGAGAYGRVMAPAAVLAQRHGYETVAPDLPGYGLTQVPWRRFEYQLWIDCVVDLIAEEQRRDSRPIVLFGVSLGGLLAYQAAARSGRVAGLIASTLADTREDAVRRDFARTPLLGSVGIKLLERLSFLTDNLPLPMAHMSKMHAISNIPELSALCSRDPLGGGNWVPARFLRSLMHAVPDVEPEAFELCPVLVVHPGEDRMTDIAHSRRFFGRLPGEKRFVVLDGASHMPTEQPGTQQMQDAVLRFLGDIAARNSTSSSRAERF